MNKIAYISVVAVVAILVGTGCHSHQSGQQDLYARSGAIADADILWDCAGSGRCDD